MRPRPLIAAVAAGAVAATAGVLAAGGSAQAPGARTLTFTEVNKGSTFNFVDNPPRSPRRHGFPTRASAGDAFVFVQPLADQAGQPAGRIHGTCAATRGGRFDRAAFVCHVVTKLHDGDITLEATLRFADNVITGAITGGTGAYNGARGTFTARGERRAIDTYELLP